MHGDRNTAFFHQKTLTRRRRNRIDAIQSDTGEWLYNVADIKAHAVQFFFDLYTNDQATFTQYPITGYYPTIDNACVPSLNAPVFDDEIKHTIFSMKPLKAPSVDGLHAIFYQSQWNIVGPSFCLFIREIFSSGNIPSEINKTLVVLIPKTDHLISFRMYRPISLCTVTYKTVTKIIANRLKAILPELIGPHQTSFVPGRHIIENIVVAQEIIHSMRRKTGNRGQMAIKVDLEKAYDRLSWDFIQDTLLETGLPTDFVHITMNCITTARMNVLWEGECTDDFIPSRGIRQGDPISPYIFVLFIERLSHGICHAVNMGEWKPIRLARHGTPLTLFFFADDLLLLAEASCDQAKVLNTVLDVFCTSSGEKMLGFSVTDNLGRYLGMPLLHSRVFKNTYQGIVDTVERRLSGWNASHLSLAGRITLAQSVIQAVPIYAMQTTSLPVYVKAKIDQACKKFIWSGANPQRKMSLVSWDKVCQPKSCGGLGLKNLEVMNKALLMKVGWNLISSPNSLWTRVLLTKYGLNKENLPSVLPTKNGSYLWKSIGKVWKDTIMGIQWNIGNGKKVRFWWDCWVTKAQPLLVHALAPIPAEIINKTAAEFVDAQGNWNWVTFSHLLPNNILLRIASFRPPMEGYGEDQIFWSESKKGNFTVKSAYDALSKELKGDDDQIWSCVWRWNGPQSIRVFLWLVLYNRLKTKAEISRRHVHLDSSCDRCGDGDENTLHVLRDCMLYGVSGFGVIKFLFHDMTWDCGTMLSEVKIKATEFQRISTTSMGMNNRRVAKWICWSPLFWLWYKLNTDGAAKKTGEASAGGLIRDHNGAWVAGFGMNIGSCSVTVAELWGLYQGLNIAWQNGIRWLQVEVDNICILLLVTTPMITTNELSPLIKSIKDLISHSWCITITHVYREANFAADFLANHALSFSLGLHLFPNPPGIIAYL
ncbi:putative ribonuclease H protein [Citrus sinensis]|uniref:Ribonuclease H protein n=1 Tax=Citrus sinensis TaxID=2711 RepID=A0ACB8JRN5_CITSI|nr:putative ribonuclease H protein [Citrus sinensis]